ncbi:hypothetical protein vseg_000575 [Gypsophila vaccaria]
MKQARKGPKAHTKAAQAQEGPKDRKSTTGMSGLPKKGGHGGKFTWSGDDLASVHVAPVSALDFKDPNYEDPDDHDQI